MSRVVCHYQNLHEGDRKISENSTDSFIVTRYFAITLFVHRLSNPSLVVEAKLKSISTALNLILNRVIVKAKAPHRQFLQNLPTAKEYRLAKGYLVQNEYDLLRKTGYVNGS